MKITFITTVKNEEKTISLFLESLKKQTRKPDEIIIVDGRSTDNTTSIIYDLSSIIKIPVRVIRKRGNRSVGRNTAIKNSSFEIIVCSDSGCILDRNWVEQIITPFSDRSVDVVAGFYKAKTNSIFEKCLASYTCTMPDKLDVNNFLPSSRSIAFRKTAWGKVKGYPENLNTCEDLVFARNMKRAGLKFVTQKNALVYWPQRKNIFQAAKQFYNYALGDGQAGYIRFNTYFLYARYMLGILLAVYFLLSINYYLLTIILVLLFLYISWSIQKNYRYVKNGKALFYLPLLQFTSDIAVISGTIIGGIKSLWDTKKK